MKEKTTPICLTVIAVAGIIYDQPILVFALWFCYGVYVVEFKSEN